MISWSKVSVTRVLLCRGDDDPMMGISGASHVEEAEAPASHMLDVKHEPLQPYSSVCMIDPGS